MQEKMPIVVIGATVASVILIIILLNASKSNVNNSNSSQQPQTEQQAPANEPLKETSPSMPVVQNQTNKKTYSQPFAMTLQDGVDYRAELTTSMGTIKIDLFEKDAPKTVNNFVALAKDGFYDGLVFHRVIEDFMIQGGDPLGVGMGGPGYKFEDEFSDTHKLVKGSLAMANSGPNTNGSQFFIVTAAETPWLDGKHTNFGIVTEGQDVVDAISKVEKDSSDKPKTPVVIEKVVIIEQ